MTSSLSPRLLACCSFVQPGARVADIGCDHGYLGIHLLENNIADFVYAADINEGPLQSAVANSKKYGLQDKMRFFLSDGVQAVPHDFDTLVCAGMGADTMISILDAAPWLKDNRYRLILQCQSKAHCLRKYLSDTGYRILEETALRDGRFLYTVMVVTYDPGAPLSPGSCYFSPPLQNSFHGEAIEYLKQVIFHLERSVNGQQDKADPWAVQALQELKKGNPL